MNKSLKNHQNQKKPAARAKSAARVWSTEKAAALRKPASFPSGADCANCGK
jgi:hypothetical protein